MAARGRSDTFAPPSTCSQRCGPYRANQVAALDLSQVDVCTLAAEAVVVLLQAVGVAAGSSLLRRAVGTLTTVAEAGCRRGRASSRTGLLLPPRPVRRAASGSLRPCPIHYP